MLRVLFPGIGGQLDTCVCYNKAMTPRELWKAYAGNIAPSDFICRYQSRNPRRCAERYVSRLPVFLGIVRRETWLATFAAPWQYSRDEVIAGLTAHLEETRSAWEPVVAARDALERIEREEAEWERAEQQRLEQEQAEWERAHAPEPAAAPAPTLSPDAESEMETEPESEFPAEMAAGIAEMPSLQEDSQAGAEDLAASTDTAAATPNEAGEQSMASGG